MSNKLKIEALEKELALLREEDAKPKLTYEQELAMRLHSKFCRHNHTDGCGWYYEESKAGINWRGYGHKEYLDKAIKLSDACRSHGVKDTALQAILEVL